MDVQSFPKASATENILHIGGSPLDICKMQVSQTGGINGSILVSLFTLTVPMPDIKHCLRIGVIIASTSLSVRLKGQREVRTNDNLPDYCGT